MVVAVLIAVLVTLRSRDAFISHKAERRSCWLIYLVGFFCLFVFLLYERAFHSFSLSRRAFLSGVADLFSEDFPLRENFAFKLSWWLFVVDT